MVLDSGAYPTLFVEDSGLGWSINLAAGFADPDVAAGGLDSLVFSEISNSGDAIYTPALQPSGMVNFTQNAEANGNQTIVYRAVDLAGATGTITLNIVVDAVNDPPVVCGHNQRPGNE